MAIFAIAKTQNGLYKDELPLPGVVSQGLFLALPDADVEADYTVLIANADDGNIPTDVVFHLDDLLRSLRNVGAVSEREIVGDLLLDGHLRSADGSGLSAKSLGIDLDTADAKQALYTVAKRGVQRLGENRAGGFLVEVGLARSL